MSDSSGAWFHCGRCGALFRVPAAGDTRGTCPECGENPAGEPKNEGPSEPVRVRRKVRRPKNLPEKKRQHRHGKRKARALMIFVIVWAVLLGISAMAIRHIWPDSPGGSTIVSEEAISSQAMEDSRLIQDQLTPITERVREFLAAADIGGRSLHILRGDQVLPEMARALRHEPIFASTDPIGIEDYTVIHTPAGRAIETLWQREDGKRVEAVLFEEQGEWKIDWHAFARASSQPWVEFLSGRDDGEGTFRVLARERIGASGRDPEFIGLVLYVPRTGHPGEAVSPSPEVRVKRNSPEGHAIEQAFELRRKDLGAFGSRVVSRDPDEMIRLHVAIARHGGDERTFSITRLIACHWMELPPAESK